MGIKTESKQVRFSNEDIEKIKYIYHLFICSKIKSYQMWNKLLEEFPTTRGNGTFSEILINTAIENRDDTLIEIAVSTGNFPNRTKLGLNLMYRLLFKEDWHYSHEEIVNTIIACGKKDMLSILTDIALFDPDHWDSYAIHNKAIREIFSIAGKDALDTLLSLRDKVDEEALPTLEKMIKRCEALQ